MLPTRTGYSFGTGASSLSGRAGHGLKQMLAEITDQIGQHVTVRELPLTVNPLEAVVVSPPDDRLQR